MINKKHLKIKIISTIICLMLISTIFSGFNFMTKTVKSEEADGNQGYGSPAGKTGVDPASGIFNWNLDLLNSPGRGIDVDINLRYCSYIWDEDPYGKEVQNGQMLGLPEHLEYNGGSQYLQDYSPVGLGFDLSMGRLYGSCNHYSRDNDNRYWYRFSFEAPNGAHILFGQEDPDYNTGGSDYGSGDEFIALDTSGARLIVTNWDTSSVPHRPTDMTVVMSDGVRYLFSSSEAVLDADNFGIESSILDDGSGDGSSGAPSMAKKYNLFKKVYNFQPIDLFGLNSWRSHWDQIIGNAIRDGSILGFTFGAGSYNVPPSIPEIEEVGSASWACYATEDKVGNRINIDYYDHPSYENSVRVLSVPQTIADTYGRIINFEAENETDMIGSCYPKIRLTDINTDISPNGQLYNIHFNYEEYNNDPYLVIDEGPFGEWLGCHYVPRPVKTADQGDSEEALTRILLTGITIQIMDSVPRTTTFGYNGFYELETITTNTDAQKQISYGFREFSSCISVYNNHYGDVGYQKKRVVNQVNIDDGTGQISSTIYDYLVETYEDRPVSIGFNQVNVIHGVTRTEYHYYTDTPRNVFTILSAPNIPETLSAVLSGMLKETRIYEDFDHTDSNPGILKQKEMMFYASTTYEYNHFWDWQRLPDCHYGNYWNVILPMGQTIWQEGKSEFVINGFGGYKHSSDLLGFYNHWEIKGGEYIEATQYNAPLMFSITAKHPEQLKIQHISYMTTSAYRNRGLPPLPKLVEQGEFKKWIWGTYGEIFIFPNSGEDFFSDSDLSSEPFEYRALVTKQFSYDEYVLEDPGIIPANFEDTYSNPVTSSLGLVTTQRIIETGDVSNTRYYRNGLVYQTDSFVDEDLGYSTIFNYGDEADGMDHGHNWGMISKQTVSTGQYGLRTSLFKHNRLGQITETRDLENNEYVSKVYDNQGRNTRSYVNGEMMSRNFYQDDISFDDVLTFKYADDFSDPIISYTRFDALKRPVVQFDGDVDSWDTFRTVEYNNFGQVTVESLPLSFENPDERRVFGYSYDSLGRLCKTIDPMGRETCESVISQIDQDLWNLGVRSGVQTTSSDGSEERIYVDCFGNTVLSQVKIDVGVWASTWYFYDHGGRLYKEVSPMGLSTFYFYDELGRLVATDTPDETADFPLVFGVDYFYPCDDFVEPSEAVADTITVEFTTCGEPKCIRTSRGFFHMVYDELGRLVRREFSDTWVGPRVTVVEFSYDPVDALWLDNCFGRLAREIWFDVEDFDSPPFCVCYGYDGRGLVSCQSFCLGDCPAKLVCFEYDNLGRVISMVYPEGDVLTYDYDGLNLMSIDRNGLPLASVQYDEYNRQSQLNLNGKSIIASYGYNDLTDLITDFDVRVITKVNNENENSHTSFIKDNYQKKYTTLLSEKYEYDQDSNLLTKIYNSIDTTQKPKLSREYSYDLMGRLISADIYNAVYNPTFESFSYSKNNANFVNINYDLDKEGLRTSKTICYDELQDIQNYHYNQGTHQLLCTTRNGEEMFCQQFDEAGSVNNIDGSELHRNCLGQITNYQNEQYAYMGGVRVKKTDTQQNTVYYLCLGQDVIAEYDEEGQLQKNHFYGFGSRIATDVDGSQPIDYLISDYHGDLRLIISGVKLKQHLYYSPYGQIILVSGSKPSTGQPVFDGYISENSRLVYANARFYDPIHGDFKSVDPAGAGTNPYTYCSGNPISLRDPTGLNPEWHPPRVFEYGTGMGFGASEFGPNPRLDSLNTFQHAEMIMEQVKAEAAFTASIVPLLEEVSNAVRNIRYNNDFSPDRLMYLNEQLERSTIKLLRELGNLQGKGIRVNPRDIQMINKLQDMVNFLHVEQRGADIQRVISRDVSQAISFRARQLKDIIPYTKGAVDWVKSLIPYSSGFFISYSAGYYIGFGIAVSTLAFSMYYYQCSHPEQYQYLGKVGWW